MAIDPERARTLLTARRAELEKLSSISAESRDTIPLDQQSVGRVSRMDALQQQAMAQATERHRMVDIAKIDAALRRIDDNEFGYCLECGEKIPEKRLEVDPAMALCINCASGKTN
ncbi:RNA polymerase-binding transcription factor DksA [bacterium MnTg02]|nr:RNA polymerase-binding transcription factor DksA [bacterium MnTg02]